MTESSVQKASPQAVLCALAAGAAFICVIAPAVLDGANSGFVVGAVFGLFFGFNAVPVIWSVIGPGGLLPRVSLCFLVVFIFFFNFVVGFTIVEGSVGSFEDYLPLFGMLPIIFLAVQIPFAVMRMVTGWRIWMVASGGDEERQPGRQFGIAQLLSVTTLVAFALAMARWSLHDEGVLPWAAMLLQLGILVIWISAVGIPCLWTVFRVRQLAISALITMLHAGLLTLAFVVIGLILIRGPGGADLITFAIGLHGSIFTVLWSGLAIIRWLGYSLGPRQEPSNRFNRNGVGPAPEGDCAQDVST